MPTYSIQRDPHSDQFARLFADPNTFGSTMLVLLVDMCGEEILNADPETIELAIRDIIGEAPRRENYDRLLAAVQVLTSDTFYQDPAAFNILSQLLSGDVLNGDVADPEDMAWGIVEAALISPPEEEEPFSIDVRTFIGVALDYSGYLTAPSVLKIGIRPRSDEDAAASVTDFSDDPSLFQAVGKLHDDRSREIEDNIAARYAALQQQHKELKLQTPKPK